MCGQCQVSSTSPHSPAPLTPAGAPDLWAPGDLPEFRKVCKCHVRAQERSWGIYPGGGVMRGWAGSFSVA